MRTTRCIAGAALGALFVLTACTDPLNESQRADLTPAAAVSSIPTASAVYETASTTGVRMMDLGVEGTAYDINDDGLAVGTWGPFAGTNAFRVRAQTGSLASDLGQLGSTGAHVARAVNSRGDIVGESSRLGFALAAGADDMTLVGSVAGLMALTQAYDVTDGGIVVGSGNPSGSPTYGWVGHVGSEDAVQLPGVGPGCVALGVDDTVEPVLVSGFCYTAIGLSLPAAHVWRVPTGGTPELIPLSEEVSTAYGVGWMGGLRWAVGYTNPEGRQAGSGSIPIVFDADGSFSGVAQPMFHLPRLEGGTLGIAQAMSNGHIAGYGTGTTGTQAIYWHMYGWTAGDPLGNLIIDHQPLGTLPGHVLSRAYGVNANGVVAGYSQGPDGIRRAVAWFPYEAGSPNEPPTVAITAPAAGAEFAADAPVTFTATATDPEQGALSGDAVQWSSSIDGVLGTGTSLTVSTLSGGLHEITVTATDAAGATGTASIGVLVSSSILAELLELQRRVNAMTTEQRIDQGTTQALGAQLATAIAQVRAGRTAAVRGLVNAMLQELDALEQSGRMGADEVGELRPGLERVQRALER
jgi:hypothetical protein